MKMQEDLENFIQSSSPDRGFLQSEEWRKFQEAVGRKTYNITGENISASIIEHSLPIVGKYFYIPRGPVCHPERAKQVEGSSESEVIDSSTTLGMTELVNLAKENKAGWIRIELADSRILDLIRKNWRVAKAPHDMQPKEILILDITKSEEELLAGMKSKTRYNIRLAEKKNVKVISHQSLDINKKYVDKFVKLVEITAKRDGIVSHPENYYRKMFEVIPGEVLKLYVAEFEGELIAANIVLFFGKTATYLHGASDNNYRNVMAPYLLQWQAIQDAKKSGCEKYDFGGVSTNYESNTNIRITNSWAGITKFKTGFAPNAKSVEFPGSYDIIINPVSYKLYRIMQKIKGYAK